MKFLAYILLTVSAIEGFTAAPSGLCRLKIARNRIASTWQSSYYTTANNESTCFNSQSESKSGQWDFIHSGEYSSSAVDGFHWFVILLNQSEKIWSVSVESRADSIVKGRAVDVELYASQLDLSSQLGPEHCSSEQIRSVFILNPSAWNYCGKTKPHAHVNDNYLTVRCDQTVRMLLLRKFVRNLSNRDHQCMNIVNMWLNHVYINYLPGRYKITTEFGNCNAASAPSADIKFTFESPDASTHLCRASDSNGKQLKITAVKNPTCDVADNVLRSQWLCSNCSSSANVSVICQADSQHQVKQFITTDCAKSNILFVVKVLTVIFTSLVLACVLIIFALKKFCSQPRSSKKELPDEPPAAVPSQPMTDLNLDAEQAGAATTTANVAQPSISMQAAAADEFYINSKLFRKA
ncbi:hypothetical protein BOX15_Mlig021334g1 [Macrostomum lignano]|uniref:Uncharacterized protein n=1 Tax=Macrostomum lignano TaxID=282301 RepID=A0A267DY59_9PLAT|nr:hypothetical protein BOX15_Mlig021334g1 [Macrostomum lignano]